MRFSHLGICVSDLERSTRFYRDALGFEPAESFEVAEPFGTLMELDGVRLRSQFLRREGMALELLHFATPDAVADEPARPLNRFGFTHLSILVDDLDEAAARVEAAGGTLKRHTEVALDPTHRFVYCADPDGTRIELMQLAGM